MIKLVAYLSLKYAAFMAIAIGINFLAFSCAYAAELKKFTLTTNQILELGNALGQLDGYDRVVKDEKGQDKIVKESYRFANGLRITLARDYGTVKSFITDVQDVAKGIKGDDTAKKEELDKIGSAKHEIELLTINEKDLQIGDPPAANPIPIPIIATLTPFME